MTTPGFTPDPATAKLPPAQQKTAVLKELAKFPGVVTATWVTRNPSLKPYQGETAVKMYAAIAAGSPSAKPVDIAGAVAEVWVSQGLATGLLAAIAATGDAVAATEKGIKTATYLPPVPGLSAATTILGDLTSANLWIRVAKVAIGAVILIVGLAKLTGADHAISPAAGTAISKGVKLAPFL